MCIPVSIFNDNVVEATELFTVTLESTDPAVQMTPSNTSVTIIDSTSKYTSSLFVLSSRSLLNTQKPGLWQAAVQWNKHSGGPICNHGCFVLCDPL